MKSTIYCLMLLALLVFGFPSRAEAYLDPSAGSIALQVLAGGLIATIATMKLYWHRIRSAFRRDRKS